MKVGLLFGSFNPVHIGHSAIANYMYACYRLEEVWWVVTPQNPLKTAQTLAGASHRLAMARLAVAAFPPFRVCDIEFSLPAPTYTIDTLHALQERYPQHEFYLIIGSDNWLQLPKWKGFKQLLSEVELLVYPRLGYELPESAQNPSNIHFTDAPRLEISSSFIRSAFAKGLLLPCFLSPEVYQYIMQYQLYQTP
ncbi:MAG: nicotinate-nucleotide adenylyltransferase [Prevotellaceae bacterium]|jgi:nicotinate-nucleotide adenylyltransferase|nr:nicotinate-nucleotide adenylyltransferase [Prevotellaceae bacterium]